MLEADETISTSEDPTIDDAISSSPGKQEMWENAIKDEFQSLRERKTRIRDDSPLFQQFPSHDVLNIKRLSDGSVDRLKCRLVAGCIFQKYGEAHMKTHALVDSFALVKIFLYLTMTENMYMSQIDFRTAFINRILEEYIWVTSPKGAPERPPRIYRLIKANYVLRQALLIWYKRIRHDWELSGLVDLPTAASEFSKETEHVGCKFLFVYADGILIFEPTASDVSDTIKLLQQVCDIRKSETLDCLGAIKIDKKINSDNQL